MLFKFRLIHHGFFLFLLCCGLKPKTFMPSPSCKSILIMFLVMLIDAIKRIPCLSMSAFVLQVIMLARVSLPTIN